MLRPFNSPLDALSSLIFSIRRMVDKNLPSTYLVYSKELTEAEKTNIELKVKEQIAHPLKFEWSEELQSGDKYLPCFKLKMSKA